MNNMFMWTKQGSGGGTGLCWENAGEHTWQQQSRFYVHRELTKGPDVVSINQRKTAETDLKADQNALHTKWWQMGKKQLQTLGDPFNQTLDGCFS